LDKKRLETPRDPVKQPAPRTDLQKRELFHALAGKFFRFSGSCVTHFTLRRRLR